MGTLAELVVQTSGAVVRDIAQGIAQGEICPEDSAEARMVADLGSKMAVIAYAKKCWALADDAVAAIDSTQLNAVIRTPWKKAIPGWAGFNMLNDEFLHHYGQLDTYARLCGAEAPGRNSSPGVLVYRFAD
jgi:hypothetical protein